MTTMTTMTTSPTPIADRMRELLLMKAKPIAEPDETVEFIGCTKQFNPSKLLMQYAARAGASA